MGKKDKRVDTYIAKSADFAKPILNHIRELIHKGCPDVEETMKWSFPHFESNGEILCSMASFKQHCAFGFWKASLMKDHNKILSTVGKTAMGHLGQIKSIKDLPPDKVMLKYIKEAARLNKEGVKLPAKTKSNGKKELDIPDYFIKALRKNKNALKTFENFSYTNKKEYVEWVTGAKSDRTRKERLANAVDWMSEGKVRNWKYIR